MKFYREDRFIYMVTEFCKGKDLVDNLDKILGNEALIKKIMKQIVRALFYCKKKRIVHR
jgi:serine/threonine protein kinase